MYDTKVLNGNQDVSGGSIKEFPIELKTSMKFEFHLRYQSPAPGGGYTNVTFSKGPNNFEVLFDCEDQPIVFQADAFKERHANGEKVGLLDHTIEFLEDILTDNKRPDDIVVKMPIGDSDKLEQIQFETITLTIMGMLFLVREIYMKSQEKTREYS